MSRNSPFAPKRGMGAEARLAHIEDFLSRLGVSPSAGGGGGGGGSVGKIPESRVIFNDETGHAHSGTDNDGTPIDHDNLTNVTANQHHNQVHTLLGADHNDTVTGTPVRGDIIYANADPKWTRLPKGGLATVLKMGASEPAWGTVAHSELSGVTADQHHAQVHGLLDDANHSDTVTRTPARGQLIVGTALSKWDRLTHPGSGTNQYLRANNADPGWATITHSELGGVGANDHHNQAHSLTGADHTVSGLTTGHLLTATGPTSFAFQAPAAADNAWTCLAIWGKLDISTTGTSAAQMNMPNHGGGGADVLLFQPRAGKVMAVSAASDATISGAGTYTVEVYAGAVGSLAATGISVTLSSATRRAYDTDAGVAFNAGDIVVPYHVRSGSITNAPTSIVWVWVKYD